jgi:hypothetical protein
MEVMPGEAFSSSSRGDCVAVWGVPGNGEEELATIGALLQKAVVVSEPIGVAMVRVVVCM